MGVEHGARSTTTRYGGFSAEPFVDYANRQCCKSCNDDECDGWTILTIASDLHQAMQRVPALATARALARERPSTAAATAATTTTWTTAASGAAAQT